jgi:hypothetical protein
MSENQSNILEKLINIIVTCPHCNNQVLIEHLNCKIFRHGMLKSNNTQINPHASKIDCDDYINNNLIYGCGKPFKIIEIINENINNEFQAVICEYI